jgi:DNA-binding beta-propeller fold protein YncE
VYATSALDAAVLWFNRDGPTGALSFGGILMGGMKGMSGALGVTTSNDGKNVYIASVFNSALVWFARNPSSGQLTYEGSFPDNASGSDTADLNGAWSVVVSPNGRHIYVVSILACSITSFSRDLVTGAPTFEGTIKGIPGFGGPTCIALDPMGKFVYVTASWDVTVSWFE